MARILLIEHQVIVREAIRHFFFPQHEVLASAAWPSAAELANYAAAIIDTETLAELGADPKEVETLLAGANTPALWLCPEDSSLPESHATSVFVRKPLDAKLLASALRDLLPPRVEPVDGHTDNGEPDGIIELTEVVEEAMPDEETN